jgi:AcrR family transcriptional regulator
MDKVRPKTPTAASLPPPSSPRERVLQAAFAAFMEKGYIRTSTLEIAKRAKVSKRDLYQICDDKPTLLREAISHRAQRMRLPLDLAPATDRKALAATLCAFGTATLRGLCDPAVRAVFRLVISETVPAPEVARALERGRTASRVALAQTFARAQANGLVGKGDPAIMATDFLALLTGDLMMQMLLRVTEPPPLSTVEQKAREATEKFLRLYG